MLLCFKDLVTPSRKHPRTEMLKKKITFPSLTYDLWSRWFHIRVNI